MSNRTRGQYILRVLAGVHLGRRSPAPLIHMSFSSIIICIRTNVQMRWQSISVYALDRHVYVITTNEYYYYKFKLVNDRYNASLQMLIIPKMKATDQRSYRDLLGICQGRDGWSRGTKPRKVDELVHSIRCRLVIYRLARRRHFNVVMTQTDICLCDSLDRTGLR
jgi:hypothetical protein